MFYTMCSNFNYFLKNRMQTYILGIILITFSGNMHASSLDEVRCDVRYLCDFILRHPRKSLVISMVMFVTYKVYLMSSECSDFFKKNDRNNHGYRMDKCLSSRGLYPKKRVETIRLETIIEE